MIGLSAFNSGKRMHLRSIALGLTGSLGLMGSMLLLPAAAETKPWRLSLAGDAYDGKAWHTSIVIELDEGWKTYWRMPGEAGVPPAFTWTTSVPANIEVKFPVPARHADESGETVGYAHRAVFPVTVEAGDASAVDVTLDLFFAVCKDICIPAKDRAEISLGAMQNDSGAAEAVSRAEAAVPLQAMIAERAEVITRDGQPFLRLALARAVDDLFVETETAAYFRKPEFSPDGRTALLAINNVKDPASLSGTALTLTARTGEAGLEQRLTLTTPLHHPP
jgi:DsbC/DsbD-like thiol-disulfide interchange protein